MEYFILIALAALSALFSYFFDFCIMNGNIFGWYGRWLDNRMNETWLYKPLGACIVCANVWHTILIFYPVAVFRYGVEFNTFELFCMILVSNFIVRKIKD